MTKSTKTGKPSRVLCMQAHCHECMAHYVDGRVDCECISCALYPYMPYAKLDPNLTWTEYNPKRIGRVTWKESKPKFTEEQLEAAKQRMKLMHRKRKCQSK